MRRTCRSCSARTRRAPRSSTSSRASDFASRSCPRRAARYSFRPGIFPSMSLALAASPATTPSSSAGRHSMSSRRCAASPPASGCPSWASATCPWRTSPARAACRFCRRDWRNSARYSECFRIAEPDDLARRRLMKALEAARLRCVTGEPFDQVGAGADSVLAVAMLRAFYMRARGDLVTVGADARRNAGDDDVVSWAERVVDAVRGTRSRITATRIPSRGDSSPAGPSLA